MRVIYNKVIPFKGFKAMNLFGVIFARSEYKPLAERTLRHEAIHTAQMRETLYAGFYVLYALEWAARLVLNGFSNRKAYRAVSFEREAYANERDVLYLETRRRFAWARLIKN